MADTDCKCDYEGCQKAATMQFNLPDGSGLGKLCEQHGKELLTMSRGRSNSDT